MIVIYFFVCLFSLEAVQAAESISNQEQLVSGDSKQVETKMEEIIPNEQIPIPSSPADVLSKEETNFTGAAIAKVHESEE